jgi:hypothetical protein
MSRDEVLMDFVDAVADDEKLLAVHQHVRNVTMYALLVLSNMLPPSCESLQDN